jgi:acyl carrier protein
MDTLDIIKHHLSDILDVDPDSITPETYLVRDLGVESIDFLELAVALGSSFSVQIDDDEIFLLDLRLHLEAIEDRSQDKVSLLSQQYPFLPTDRIEEILQDLNSGPVLKVKDLVSYLNHPWGRK